MLIALQPTEIYLNRSCTVF